MPWECLPRELRCSSGMTRWRRLQKWMQASVWRRVYEADLQRFREYDQIMWDRASVNAASVPAPAGGEHTGQKATEREANPQRASSFYSSKLVVDLQVLQEERDDHEGVYELVRRPQPGSGKTVGLLDQVRRPGISSVDFNERD